MRCLRCVAAGLVLILLFVAMPARASDDSNSGNLARTPTVNTQATAAALNALSQNLNDTRLRQEVNQFNSQIGAGNYKAAASTLAQLRLDAEKNPNSSAGLEALLKSLNVGPNGLSIDQNLLSSLLGLNNSLGGGPTSKFANESPQQVSLDLNTLSNLLQGVNPALAADLFKASQSALGASGTGLPGFQLGNIHPPSISPPSIGGGPAAISSNPAEVILPILLIGGVLVVFLSRRRIVNGLGTQALPGSYRLEDDDFYSGLDPMDPRQRIIMLFGRTIQIMRGKGVPKLRNETHREFSSRLEGRQDGPHVSKISSLYEKARFSPLDVAPADAEDAQREVEMLERVA